MPIQLEVLLDKIKALKQELVEKLQKQQEKFPHELT
jgi:hypothetical protein